MDFWSIGILPQSSQRTTPAHSFFVTGQAEKIINNNITDYWMNGKKLTLRKFETSAKLEIINPLFHFLQSNNPIL